MSLSIVADFEVEGAGAGYAAMRRESSIKILAGTSPSPKKQPQRAFKFRNFLFLRAKRLAEKHFLKIEVHLAEQ